MQGACKIAASLESGYGLEVAHLLAVDLCVIICSGEQYQRAGNTCKYDARHEYVVYNERNDRL